MSTPNYRGGAGGIKQKRSQHYRWLLEVASRLTILVKFPKVFEGNF
jgi:hypothetical protein